VMLGWDGMLVGFYLHGYLCSTFLTRLVIEPFLFLYFAVVLSPTCHLPVGLSVWTQSTQPTKTPQSTESIFTVSRNPQFPSNNPLHHRGRPAQIPLCGMRIAESSNFIRRCRTLHGPDGWVGSRATSSRR
jgi:hypothetical protein